MWWASITLIWVLVGDPWLAIIPSLFMAFGDATALDQVKPFVLGHVGRPFAVWVQRGNNRVKLDMTARTWAGEGLLGCRLLPLQ